MGTVLPNESHVVDVMRSLADHFEHEMDMLVNGMGLTDNHAKIVIKTAVERLLAEG